MSMGEMRKQLAAWGYDDSMYSDLSSGDLKAYFASAKAEQAAKSQSDSADGAGTDQSVSEGDRGADAATVVAEDSSDSLDSSGSLVGEEYKADLVAGEVVIDDAPAGALICVEVLSHCRFVALGDVVFVGPSEERFAKGQDISVKQGDRLALDDKTFSHLSGYKLVKPVGRS